MAYLLDANVFIEAKNRYYAFDICPGFWDCIAAEHAKGKLMSVEKVRDELIGREDELSTWVKQFGKNFFVQPGPELLDSLTKLAAWVQGRNYRQGAVTEFLDSADYS